MLHWIFPFNDIFIDLNLVHVGLYDVDTSCFPANRGGYWSSPSLYLHICSTSSTSSTSWQLLSFITGERIFMQQLALFSATVSSVSQKSEVLKSSHVRTKIGCMERLSMTDMHTHTYIRVKTCN